MANDLAEYRADVLAALLDTGVKYSTTTLDAALRRCLNDYTRAFPNFNSSTITLLISGRSIPLPLLSDLISVFTCLHPYDATLPDIYSRAREDYFVTWVSGVPYLHITESPLPLTGDQIYLEYAAPQKLKDLDGATSTTIRLDHKQIIITGASGYGAMIRSQSLNEQWGGLPGQMPNLSQWGHSMVKQFNEQLLVIRQELNLNPFTKTKWKLDSWDR